MRAITQSQFGDPSVLTFAEVPDPSPLPTELVVRVHATSFNPVEAYIRDGRFPLLGQPPFILGWDVSGVVDSVVPGTNRFKVGDEVFGMPLFPRAAGAYAEKVAAPSRQLALKPKSLSHEQAAALPLAGLTAWQSLVDVADVKAGDRVLIHAGAGGVGHLAVQIAKARGAWVAATVSARNADFVRELGADEVIDYHAVDFAEAARNIDVVVESVGGDYGDRSLKTLRKGGLLITLVERLNTDLKARTEAAGKRFAGLSVEPDAAGLEALGALADAGKLRVHVDRVFPLSQAADAHAHVHSGRGKVVLKVV